MASAMPVSCWGHRSDPQCPAFFVLPTRYTVLCGCTARPRSRTIRGCDKNQRLWTLPHNHSSAHPRLNPAAPIYSHLSAHWFWINLLFAFLKARGKRSGPLHVLKERKAGVCYSRAAGLSLPKYQPAGTLTDGEGWPHPSQCCLMRRWVIHSSAFSLPIKWMTERGSRV